MTCFGKSNMALGSKISWMIGISCVCQDLQKISNCYANNFTAECLTRRLRRNVKLQNCFFVTFHFALPILQVSSDGDSFSVLGFHRLCPHLWAVLQVGTQMDQKCLAQEFKVNPSQSFCRKSVSSEECQSFEVNTLWKCLQLFFARREKKKPGILMQSELNLYC